MIRRARLRPVSRKKSLRRVTPDGREILRRGAYQQRRKEVWERDGRRCVVCHRAVELSEAEIDHIKERSDLGGRDDRKENLETLCGGAFGCHAKKHR